LRFATQAPILTLVPLRAYDQNCSIARTLQVVGERWTLLVLREVFTGQWRFEEIQRNLGVATNILSDRLQTLLDAGILERRALADRSDRSEYRLTEKGLDLNSVLLELMRWGDRWDAPAGAPMAVEHRDCGHETHAVQTCSHCGGELTARNVRVHPGPGARAPAPSLATSD
jgi:DNA-binding HxlR family transcriptional regulator